MADIMQGTSEYLLGINDTASVLLNNISPMDANQPNGLADAIIQLQTALGPGTDLVGALDNLSERLAVQVPANGWIIKPGDIWMTGRSTAGDGWLLCDGSAVSRTLYVDLFTAIGVTFGPGNSIDTFNVPDLRGRVPIGTGTGTGDGASGTGKPTGGSALSAIALAAWKGENAHALTEAEGPTHEHTLTDPGHNHTERGGSTGGGASQTTMAIEIIGDAGGTTGTDNSTAASTTGITMATSGSGALHNNIQPVMGLNFIIKT